MKKFRLIFSLVLFIVIGSIFYPDSWYKLSNHFPRNQTIKVIQAQKATLFDYKSLRGSVTDVSVFTSQKGILLDTSWPRRIVSGSILVPWSFMSACSQVLWCPGRDTIIWLNDSKLEIVIPDNERTLLKTCNKNGVPIVGREAYNQIKYGEMRVQDAKNNEALQLLTLSCSESSFY